MTPTTKPKPGQKPSQQALQDVFTSEELATMRSEFSAALPDMVNELCAGLDKIAKGDLTPLHELEASIAKRQAS